MSSLQRTSGLSTSATHKRKHDYDPLRQWGLKPEESSAASGARATYVVSGHVVNGTSSDPRTMYVTENIGRDGQAKAKRKLEAMDADKALKSLLERDKEGMQSVIKAREAGALKEVKDVKQTGKGKNNTSQRTALDDEKREMQRKTSYSAEFVKSLGFNPSLKAGQRISNSKHIHEKVWKAIECFSVAFSPTTSSLRFWRLRLRVEKILCWVRDLVRKFVRAL